MSVETEATNEGAGMEALEALKQDVAEEAVKIGRPHV